MNTRIQELEAADYLIIKEPREQKIVPSTLGADVHDPCENGGATTRDFLR